MLTDNFEPLCRRLRRDVIAILHERQSGHPGGSLSVCEILATLYMERLRNLDPARPDDPRRDRLVLCKGHAAPMLYRILAEKGFFSIEEMHSLRTPGSRLQGHPCMAATPGVDMTSGSLGQGVSAAVGMALSAKLTGDSYRVYAVLGDGELEEGQVWEAMMFAGNKQLDNLVIVADSNGIQLDGTVEEINSPQPIDEKMKAFHIHPIVVDGHDFDQLHRAFEEARTVKGQPTAIIAKTVKGKGVSYMENQVSWHGSAPNKEQYEKAMEELEKAGEALCQK